MFKRRVNLSDQITIICEVMGFVAVHVKTAFIAMIRRFAQTQEFQTFSYERPLFVCYSLAGYSQALLAPLCKVRGNGSTFGNGDRQPTPLYAHVSRATVPRRRVCEH
jgi:hypothetical protein